MPTYEYECQKCKRQHEVFQSITAKPLRTCSKCGGRIKRLLGRGSGFLFKGSGFYITDYRSKSYQDAKQKDQSRQADSKKPATKSDAKPTGETGASPAAPETRAKSSDRRTKT